jgi:spore maturation protein CgeB
LYQRAKIGINVHNRGDYTVGSYRLFELPGNGVMQISDGGQYLDRFFKVDEEIIGYRNADELIDKIRYYLSHEAERKRVALNGYRRVMRDHRFQTRMHELGNLVKKTIQRTNLRLCAVQNG